MSGYSPQVASGDVSLEEGVNFVSKPFDPEKLARTLTDGSPHVTIVWVGLDAACPGVPGARGLPGVSVSDAAGSPSCPAPYSRPARSQPEP
mgnify:CR=1 FL=1